MFRTFLLIFSLCGLTALSVMLSYRASAEAYECQPQPVGLPEAPLPYEMILCLPSVQPPACEMPECQAVPHPLHRQSRKCLRLWHEVSETVFASPQVFPCFFSTMNKLDAVAMASTLDVMRALSR